MYRGREGQWAFVLHRLSGLAIVFYLYLHVVNIGLAMFGPDVSGPVLKFFHQGAFRIGLVLVMAGVVYHALNGLRITLMDFTTWGVRHQRALWYGVLAVTTVIGLPVLFKVVPEIIRDLT